MFRRSRAIKETRTFSTPFRLLRWVAHTSDAASLGTCFPGNTLLLFVLQEHFPCTPRNPAHRYRFLWAPRAPQGRPRITTSKTQHWSFCVLQRYLHTPPLQRQKRKRKQGNTRTTQPGKRLPGKQVLCTTVCASPARRSRVSSATAKPRGANGCTVSTMAFCVRTRGQRETLWREGPGTPGRGAPTAGHWPRSASGRAERGHAAAYAALSPTNRLARLENAGNPASSDELFPLLAWLGFR